MKRDELLHATTITKRLAILLFLAGLVLLVLRLATDNSSAQNTSSVAPPTASSTELQTSAIAEAYGKLELSFIPNKGQTHQRAKFISHGQGYKLFLTKTETVLSLHSPRADSSENRLSSVLSMRLVGADKNAKLEGGDKRSGKVNYFIGKQPKDWHVDIPTYGKVTHRKVYPGIDLVYYGNQSQLEYDFVVAPGAEPARIRFQLEGAEQINLDDNGDLRLTLTHGEVRLRKPVIYQLTNQGTRQEVEGQYVVTGKEVTFKIGTYNRRKSLVIDPVLIYSTFLGGSDGEQGLGIAVDSQGNAYVTGITFSTDFPLVAPFQGVNAAFDEAFVSKLNPAGTALVYSTYFGGNGSDVANTIAVDAQGNAYIAGLTGSGSFPTTPGAFQTTKSGAIDGFVTKLNASGSALVYSTYIGGDNNETIFGIAVDATGRAHVVGRTDSTQLNFIPLQRNGSPVYKSTDGAVNWSASDAQLTASAVNGFALDPTNSNTLYAATNFGVFKSINAGANWNLTGTARTSTAPGFTNTVVVDPTNASVVYAGGASGVYKSVDGGSLYDQKSSGLGGFLVNALAIDPSTPTTLYAATIFGIYKSTNAADSWTEIRNGITGSAPRVNEVAIDPTNTSTIYIGTTRGMFKSTNGGALWVAINSGPMSNPIPEITGLVIDPLAPSTLYAAARFSSHLLFKSTDGGATWTGSSNGLIYSVGGQSILPQVNMLAINPISTGTLYAAASGGGIYKSTDGGANWSQANSDVIKSQTLAVAVDRVNPAIVYAGTSIGADAFFVRLDGTGSGVGSLLKFGGNQNDEARGIALDANNNAYVVGTTNSQNFPVQNAFQSNFGGLSDAFVSKIEAAGAGFTYSTFLGGGSTDLGRAIAVRDGRAYVVGQTFSSNFPLVNPIKPTLDQFDGDAFITGFNAAGSALDFSTYFGGVEGTDDALGIALDSGGAIYVTGSTSSPLFPVLDAPQPARDGSIDAFVTKLNPAGTAISYSTYLGGFMTDVGNGIAVDNFGNAFVVGNTSSTDFPNVGAVQPTLKITDAFITKIGIQADLSVTKTDSRDPVLVNSPFTYTLNVNNNGPSAATGVTVVDTLPPNVNLNSATPSQGSCSLNNSIVTCNLGALAPTASAVIDLSVTPTATGLITNTATVTGTEPDTISANNTAAQTTKISASPSIRGRVTDGNNIGLSGVLMTLTGTQAGTVLTDSSGFYQFAELPSGGNYVITPSKANFSIEPESRTFNSLTADQTADFVAAVCTYSITPLTQSFNAAGGTGTVSVTSLRGCQWTASSSDSWLNITSGASGVGSGTVNFSVDATTVPRAARLTIAGLNFSVYQEFNSCDALAFNVATYNLQDSPTVIRAADLNGDGKMDLALGTTGLQGGDIKASVMLNNGTGNFVTSNFGTGLGIPQGLVLGDFNSDGKPDMASTTYNTSFVRIFFNNGAGGFGQSNVDIPFTSQGQAPLTRAPFTADVNKDGKVDLLISTPGTNGLQVLIGDGAGGFTQAAPISLGGIFALITVSDLNGDGNDDLLLGGASSLTPLGVKLGDGSGGFGAPIVSTGINFLSTAVIADYDGDGKLDLAAPSNVTIGSPPSTFPALVVMSGDGTGRFTRKTTLSMSQPGVGGFTGGDFNRDGKADVAFVWGSTRVTALFGDGIGGLGSPIDTDTGGNSQFPGNGGLVAADFNGDGRPDLAAANYTIGAKVLLSTCPAASVSLSISDVNVIEGNSGTTNAVFNVSLSAPSAQTVSVSYETIDGTGFSTNDYVGSSGSVTFTPGQTEKTITVPVNGDTIVESNDSFFVNLFNPTNATFTKTLGTATILNDDGQTPVQLLMEDSVSPPNQLAAIDAIVFVKGPFHVLSIAQWLQVGSDQNTRVVIFAKNLQLNQGETAAAVEINLANGNYTNTIFAEDVRPVANTDFAQVTFRLPNNLPSGICAVSVRLRGQVSNSGTIHIVP